jgi:hypothetical protein
MKDKIEYTDADILEIAKKQQMVLWAFFFCLFIFTIPNTKGVAVIIFAIFIYQLAKALRSPNAWLYAILAIIPFIGFITLAVINSKATAALRKRGVRVGIMGARKADLSKFYEPKPAA